MLEWTLTARVTLDDCEADVHTAAVEGGYIGRAVLPGWPPLEDPVHVSHTSQQAAERAIELLGELVDGARHH